MPELKLDDVTLNYEVDDFTDPWLKPEVVFLHHGCGRHMGYWYRWVPILARKYKVVRIDARGFGKSSEPPSDYKWTIEGFAKDVIALLDHLEIPQVNFVGEFMGSWTGMQLALDYPGRIKNLVGCAPPYFAHNSKGMVHSIDMLGVKGYALAVLHERFGDDVVYGKWFAEEMAKGRAHLLTTVISAASGVDYRSRLSELRCPVLVLMGEIYARDYSAETIQLMREKLPKSSAIVFLEGGRMYVLYNMAEKCAELSMKFFEKAG